MEFHLDGVWWAEDYDPSALSAPRGAIFTGRVSALKAQPMPWEQFRGDLAELKKPTWVTLSLSPRPEKRANQSNTPTKSELSW
jgi:hypothetical protein